MPGVPPPSFPPREAPVPWASSIPLGVFALTGPLGRGGHSVVWAGVHPATGTPVAVKVLAPRFARDPVHLSAFRNEIRAAGRLHHPHVVLVHGHGLVDGRAAAASGGRLAVGAPFLVMEPVRGGTLRDHLGTPPWPRLQELLLGLLAGLAHAHARGVIHRDVKPDNVLLARAGGPPKLADFGFAHGLELDRGAAFDREFAGTPAYMAPEQLRLRWRDYGPWTDLYGLGCVAYALACGRPPFGANRNAEDLKAAHTHGEIPRLAPRMEVPRGFDSWIRKLLVKDPERRCRRAADAARALRLLTADPTGAGSGPISLLGSRVPGPPRPPLPLATHGLLGVRPLPLLAREEEQDVLWDTLRDVSLTRRAAVFGLCGPRGTGATALAAKLGERAHAAGAATVLRAAHSREPSSPDGLLPMLRRSVRTAGLGPGEIVVRLRRGAPLDPARADVLAAALHDGSGDLSEVHASIRAHLARLCVERPVVLHLDDAVVDPGTVAFVASLALDPATAAAPILVIATSTDEDRALRPGDAERLDGACALTLALDPLPVAVLHLLAADVLGLPPEPAAEAAARARGRPGEVVARAGVHSTKS